MFWSPEIESMDRARLGRLQLERLKRSVETAARSPFYSRAFADAGVKADDIRGLEDVRRLPFTTKQDLRDGYPAGMLACPRDKVVRMHASSGTTGQATVIYHTREDLDAWTDLVTRGLVMAGCTESDVFQNMMTYGLFTGGLGLHYGAERLGMMTIPIGGGNTHRQLQFFRDFGTTVIHITPSYALHVIDVIRDAGLSPDGFDLRVLIFGGEPYSESTRDKLEEAYGVTAFNCYGLSELNGPGVAFECRRSPGMHVWEDNFLVEVVNPETLEPVPFGEIGEVVLTNLNRTAMPLIRYRTRDLAALFEETGCPCGRGFRRLSRITGRTDDMLIIRGVNVFPSQIEHILMEAPEVGNNYEIVLSREDNLDRIKVRVEICAEAFHGDLSELRALRHRLQHALREEVMVNVEADLLEPGTLPPVIGKAKRVIDNRCL
ncbi:MAG TPA: phenylacetate--CoA ligase [bacterium]|nr:phenylacetate--CoA ligase [bacterium]HPQ67312.1 phenylacetate--CoA ligase [bacterium]